MICDFCNYAGEPAEFVEVFGLMACADFGGCLNRQAAAQPQNYELAVLAQDRAANCRLELTPMSGLTGLIG